MTVAVPDTFQIYVLGFIALIVLPWVWDAARERRHRLQARRRAACPLCGKAFHPEPAIARIKCRRCGFTFESKPEPL